MEKSKIDVKIESEGDAWYVKIYNNGIVVSSVRHSSKSNAKFNKESILRALEFNSPEVALRFLIGTTR